MERLRFEVFQKLMLRRTKALLESRFSVGSACFVCVKPGLPPMTSDMLTVLRTCTRLEDQISMRAAAGVSESVEPESVGSLFLETHGQILLTSESENDASALESCVARHALR